jgi:ligand-binding SRPBCC domain-containing protein
MKSQFQFEQWVPFPLAKVFLFFANPKNLPRIMPPATATRLQEVRLIPPPEHTRSNPEFLAGVGSEIVTSFRMLPFLPFRAQWIALITEFEWDDHFADVQKTGPFKLFHHRHELAAETPRRRVRNYRSRRHRIRRGFWCVGKGSEPPLCEAAVSTDLLLSAGSADEVARLTYFDGSTNTAVP